MKKIMNILISVLLFWFTLDILGMKIGNFYLVESAIKDEPIDIIWWVIFVICFIVFIMKDKVGKYILLSFVSIWCFIQYSMYFKSPKRIEDYNRFFKETHHIISTSNNFLIKDTYHIFLDLFLFVVLINLIIFIVKSKKSN
ncbi:hypothetical protein LGL08_19560 [Clostridium estertheticum]|uniref:hypothetical protein n=1 Tax=Clostridium estertheticum TaxID=238834 RepID=UPI001CF1BA71|nr:hypothetical protein [Clostridium estertheticum]MCB2308720.1 hypothetical protein [Clostridium estertheticum]MCB2347449.1 hypothetical protein [Clostridium estertheticum]MCB2351726.1 hypothetical protein [Clostridium estertheticum]WAG46305.1 hypothetical protein LL127_01700 [Clostridium estertheticum]